MHYDILLAFILATSALALSPGPDNIYVLLQSIAHGTKYGIATVCGLISGCLLHTTLVAFGVSAVLKANESLFFIIKLFGAAYLLFLAYKVYSASDKITLSDSPVPKKTYGELFKQGVIMNVLNPKVSIFFLAFFPGFLFDDSLSTVTQFYVLGLLFMITSFIIFTLIAILAGLISTAIKKRKHIGVVLKWLQIVVFIAIAILILI
ncbi:LysE family translocator [Bizionia paragorgiae]|uniref:Threonine/homoserine/homoserine lactone efflux protein n=1 Tax=Bizionia paragorgiae TaxID=283786 RepID=A0A1H3VEI5_BIZPA|nr:LysE family translocator [Bizionia paragorgiae]MDX1272215.1 LysE family translocator [Bizionia paragorgiae]SDZ72634.1 Threonine/homoserine/homoserine lactone efflux protein [Bizionia paragorgiae]